MSHAAAAAVTILFEGVAPDFTHSLASLVLTPGVTGVWYTTAVLSLGFGVMSYVLSLLTNNDSWGDRLWAIMPVFYAWFYVVHLDDAVVLDTAGGGQVQLTGLGAIASVITIWGARLTYNFYRRGLYSKGGEDHRWAHIRSWPVWKNRVLWHIYRFSFISVFQQCLLWGMTLPMLAIPANTPLNGTSTAVAVAMLFFIVMETIADQQQWNFQNEKRNVFPRRAEYESDYKNGFLTHGLFSASRHPNVFSEDCMWLSLYAVSIAVWGVMNVSAVGALTLVFATTRSCALTEELSTAKYPAYAQYAKVVPVLLPAPWSLRSAIDAKLKAK